MNDLDGTMAADNLERMIRLADEFFATKNDPLQISFNEHTQARLSAIHESTMSETRDENGPIAWVLVIPTTVSLMQQFVDKQITEQELLQNTPLDSNYEALYLCSALVLPEQRRKGIAKHLVANAIRSIQTRHRIKFLFYWAFSEEGKNLAESVAKEFNMPLRSRAE
jgi:ribosomal protein S18 acetylase RimI-like enzyme